MTIEFEQFTRKPFAITAVKVTEANMAEVAKWCGGKIVSTFPSRKMQSRKYIQVPVYGAPSNRQTQAFVDDRVTVNGKTFKVYTRNAFEKSFDRVVTVEQIDRSEVKIMLETSLVPEISPKTKMLNEGRIVKPRVSRENTEQVNPLTPIFQQITEAMQNKDEIVKPSSSRENLVDGYRDPPANGKYYSRADDLREGMGGSDQAITRMNKQ